MRCSKVIKSTGRRCKNNCYSNNKCWAHCPKRSRSSRSRSRSRSRTRKRRRDGSCIMQNGGGDKNELEKPKLGKWTVYGRSSCPFTRKAVEMLMLEEGPEDIVFHDTDVLGIDPSQAVSVIKKSLGKLVKTNYKTIPMIFKNKNFIGGYSDLIEYY